ncbi:MAG TPA: HAD-IA family hydrolase [Opitutaceae bacterium]|nr:HAD-IA family hydrolase [Opitutaceae bacterium]
MIRALIFDFDGLIIDTETPLIDAWAALHERAGRAYSRADAHRLVGQVEVEFDPWVAFGPAADREALEAEHRRLSRDLTAQQPILPGVLACLQDARALGLQLAIASNSSREHVAQHLARLGLNPYFALTCCREDVAAGKPAPDLYLRAIQRFGVTPAEAIALEDSTAGTLAARAAGLWTVAVPNPSTHRHDFSAAHLVLSSLADTSLAELLARFTRAGGSA